MDDTVFSCFGLLDSCPTVENHISVQATERRLKMDARKHSPLLIALLIGAGVAVTGCNKPNSPETVGQRVDRTTDKMAAQTSSAADKIADKTSAAASKTGEDVEDTEITTKVKT